MANYSNIAVETTITGAIGTGDLTLTVADATGYPAAPFRIVLDPGVAASEEVCQVTAKAGPIFTVTRGYDGTTAKGHSSGATVIHAVVAADLTDLQAADTAEASARSAADALRLTIASNLSDLNNPITAQSNLGLGRVFYPELYGAVGNGTTDDTAAIQAAIDAAGATGGTVYFKTGSTYKVTRQGTATGDSLTTPYCVKIDQTYGPIILAGRKSKIFLADSQVSNTIPILIRGTSVAKRTNLTAVVGFEVYSNPATQTPWTDFSLVEVAYTDNYILDKNYLHDSPFMCSQVFRESENALITDNRFVYSAYGNGLRIEIKTGRVLHNIFEGDPNITKSCLDLSCNSDIGMQGEDIQVIGNLFKSGYIGISLAGQARTQIANNTLYGFTNSNGIAIAVSHYSHVSTPYSCVDCSIVNNTIYDSRRGVVITGAALNGVTGLLVADNQIVEGPSVNLSVGISEQSISTVGNNLIVGNRITGATTGIDAAGAPANGTQVYNNLVDTTFGGIPASNVTSGALALARGGTNADLSASGGSTKVLAQDASHIISARDLVAGDIPNLDASKVTTGTMATARLGSGTANNTTFLRGDQTYAVPAGGFASVVNRYTSNTTVTPPSGWTKCRVRVLGSGGGGGSGRRGAAASARSGGTGGSSGSITELEIFAADLVTRSLTGDWNLTVGASPGGGAARTTDDTDGAAGTAGNLSKVDIGGTIIAQALGGGAGAGGTNANGTGGSSPAGQWSGVNGGGTSVTAGSTAGTAGQYVGGGGGGGGGITTGDAVQTPGTGGSGGRVYDGATASSNAGASGTSGASPTNGGAATAVVGRPGGGGGGGGSSITVAAGNGGAGVNGGGGGGGGASLNGNNSGAGGAGGAGVIELTWS